MNIYPISTTDDPVLSVCVCSLENRKQLSHDLFVNLAAQASSLNVEVLIAHDNGEDTSGAKRHALSVTSRGKYIAFVDDDDLVSEDYLGKLVAGCNSNAHAITFNVLVHNPKNTAAFTRVNIHTFNIAHDVKPQGIHNDPKLGTVMLVGMWPSHLCAWRRDIQRKIAYDPKMNCKDDAAWIEPLIASGVSKSEYRIPTILYTYRYSDAGTVNQTQTAKVEAKKIVGGGFECFREGGDFYISELPIEETNNQPVILCRDADNNPVKKRRDRMERFHVFELPW